MEKVGEKKNIVLKLLGPQGFATKLEKVPMFHVKHHCADDEN